MVITHTPSKRTAPRRIRAAASENSRTPVPRCASRVISSRVCSGETTAMTRVWHAGASRPRGHGKHT